MYIIEMKIVKGPLRGREWIIIDGPYDTIEEANEIRDYMYDIDSEAVELDGVYDYRVTEYEG